MQNSVVLALALASGASAMNNTTEHVKFAFEAFKAEYGRSYGSAMEERERFEAFGATLVLIEARNAAERAAGGSAQHGITRFADLTQREFAKRYLRTEAPADLATAPRVNPVSLAPPPTGAAGGSQDWAGIYTTPVKNQGYCGSCWAFSVTEQVESDSMRTMNSNYILGPQELVSCDSGDSGCDGGWPTNAYNWIAKNGGQVSEADYPYTSGDAGVVPACNNNNMAKLVTVTNYYTLTSEASMASHALATGPISIAVDANNWSTYTGGVMTSCGQDIDHAVQAVGVDTGSGGFWKIRNSWGTGWGEAGFIRLAYGANTCALTTIPTYVAAKKA